MHIKKIFNPRSLVPLLLINLILLTLLFTTRELLSRIQYLAGNKVNTNGFYFDVQLFLGLFLFLALCVIFLLYLISICIICYRNGLSSILPAVLLAILTIGYFRTNPKIVLNGPVYILNGYNDMIRQNVDINVISEWIKEYDLPVFDTVYDVPKEECPEVIADLSPSSVCFEEVSTYKVLRIIHSRVSGEFGLTVSDVPVVVPYVNSYGYEYRIQVQSNAFVWYANTNKPKYFNE